MEAKGSIIFMEVFFFLFCLQPWITVKTTFNHNFAYTKEHLSLAPAT